ncbi:hypothetical protein OF83DRAFT_1064300 [Amylostereum chailletii]|nr:hypothetical protein OF83DRAFT_1064300 [Amylostereum chailletii]
MVTHFYDTSPYSVHTMETRLKPARAVTDSAIPCLVWAEDALSFVQFVPTLFFDLHLLIPDEKIEQAARAIMSTLQYKSMIGPKPSWLETSMCDPTMPSCHPNSVWLQLTTPPSARHEDDPGNVVLHPASYWSFDVRDPSLSVALVPPLSPPHSNIRFPNTTSFLDSLITWHHARAPSIGFCHRGLTRNITVYISYIILYDLRTEYFLLENGDIAPAIVAIAKSLKPENAFWLESFARGKKKGWMSDAQARRSMLERMECVFVYFSLPISHRRGYSENSRVDEARRPLPRDTWVHTHLKA